MLHAELIQLTRNGRSASLTLWLNAAIRMHPVNVHKSHHASVCTFSISEVQLLRSVQRADDLVNLASIFALGGNG